MHKSRLAGFIIDCEGKDLDGATRFWSAALGLPRAGREGTRYEKLDASARDLYAEVQVVDHPSRVHLDIEADDLEAEVARLEALGARRVARIETWVVLEAPTGQRFCVVRSKGWEGKPGVNTWP
jgi:catechol 2,3-dioxygenase-like lactoylglutathione lyase family enzyme